jgi:hypothetical protein
METQVTFSEITLMGDFWVKCSLPENRFTENWVIEREMKRKFPKLEIIVAFFSEISGIIDFWPLKFWQKIIRWQRYKLQKQTLKNHKSYQTA